MAAELNADDFLDKLKFIEEFEKEYGGKLTELLETFNSLACSQKIKMKFCEYVKEYRL